MQIIDGAFENSILDEAVTLAEGSRQYGLLHPAGGSQELFKYNWTFYHREKSDEMPPVLNKIWERVQNFLPANHSLYRGYVNAHSYGVEDLIHQDDVHLPKGVTVIVYLCQEWYAQWFGQTLFFDAMDYKNAQITHSVLPKYNRMIIFDKNIPHCVSPLSRKFSGIRLTCMFKVELLNDAA